MNHSDMVKRLSCVTAYSCQYDQRFIYYIYVPRNYGQSGAPAAYDLMVLIHGTERAAETYRNKFKDFANKNNCVILAPLFPAGTVEPNNLENYSLTRYQGTAYDLILLKMIEEAAQRFPIITHKFWVHGFSAGGQFAASFLYLHPDRLHAVSIGAPGEVTHPRWDKTYPTGLNGFVEFFNQRCDLDNLRQIPLQIVVGELDISPRPAQDEAPNRLARSRLLFNNLRRAGMEGRLDVVPEVGHDGFKLLPAVFDFFEKTLTRRESE